MVDGNPIADAAAVALRGAELRLPTTPVLNTPAPNTVRTSPETALTAAAVRTPELSVEDFSTEELRDVAFAFGEVVSLVNRDLRIIIDEGTGRIVTQIVDGETNEVVRQLPPEALLDVARRVADLVGLLLDEER